MNKNEVIKKYLKALEVSSYKNMINLFTKDAIIVSPLYGKIEASKFYKKLFDDTLNSKITLLNTFEGDNDLVGAGYFSYDWKLKDGTSTSFECVDVFQFDEKGKIKQLTIIYDTYKIRDSFNKLKK